MDRSPTHETTTSKRSLSDASKSGIFMATSNQNTSQIIEMNTNRQPAKTRLLDPDRVSSYLTEHFPLIPTSLLETDCQPAIWPLCTGPVIGSDVFSICITRDHIITLLWSRNPTCCRRELSLALYLRAVQPSNRIAAINLRP